MAANDIAITWLGHAAFSITTPEGKVVLIDPFLAGNPACPDELKDPATVDVLLVSHGHGDHLGDTAPIALRTAPEAVVSTVDIAGWLGQQGVANAIGMNKGGTIHVADLAVKMVHADHTSSICGRRPAGCRRRERRFHHHVLQRLEALLRRGYRALWRHGALRQALPTGPGHSPHRRPFHHGAGDAAEACRMLGVKRVIPCHYGTFPLLTGTLEDFCAAAEDIGGLEICAMQPGETIRV